MYKKCYYIFEKPHILACLFKTAFGRLTVLPKVKKLKINSPDSSFRILSPWHPTKSPGSKIKNFYALGCVIYCDLANNMP